MLLNKGNISREHSERIQFVTALNVGYRYVVAVLLAGWLLKRVSVAVLIREESYGHEDPSRALLASEKALSTRVWVS